MTLQTQGSLMTDEELSEFGFHMQNLHFDAIDDQTTYRVRESRDGVSCLYALLPSRLSARTRRSLDAVNALVHRGLVDVEEDTDRNPIINPKAVSPHCPPQQDTPVSHMSADEIMEFDEALETVRRHQALGDCVFESWRDDNTNLYTRARVTEQAPEEDAPDIARALRIVSQRLHDGSAVRVPIPEGGIMIMSCWDLRQPENALN